MLVVYGGQGLVPEAARLPALGIVRRELLRCA